MRRRIAVLTAGLALLAACDNLQGPGYRGEPLATLRGELTAATSTSTSKPDHLALGWLNWSRSATAFSVTQKVEFQGSFPFEYQFNVYEPPPEAAMQAYSGGRLALGGLLAYRDTNGNGELDSIPEGSGPIDLVLGASTSLNWNDGERYYEVLYVEGTPPRGFPGSKPGFNLVTNEGIVPLDTPIPIGVAPAPRHNLLLCQAFADTFSMEDWNRCLGDGPARIFGSLHLSAEYGPSAYLEVFRPEGRVTDATVTLNGVALVSDGFGYVLAEGSNPLAVASENVVHAVLPSGEETSISVFMDPAPVITSPDADAQLDKDEPVTVQWEKVEGAVRYAIGIHVYVDGRLRRRYGGSEGTSYTIAPWSTLAELTQPLPGHLSVSTLRSRSPLNGSDLGAWNGQYLPVTFTP